MPAYTYQIAIKTNGNWYRDYFCAESRAGALGEFMVKNGLTEAGIRYIKDSATHFEIESCAD